MDYIEAFGNLKTSGRRSCKAVYKAVLLLAVIDMYENNAIDANEIVYNNDLKSNFIDMWRKVLPTNATLFPDAYMAFWYLQEESFWHIVPVYGKEYVFENAALRVALPSENVFEKSVRYAELDEDLFFLMTLPSGRTSLRKVLLENYSELSDKKIDIMSASKDNNVDNFALAINDYTKMLLDVNKGNGANDGEQAVPTFDNLSDDFQITLNIAYYTFLKNHKEHRDWLRNMYPTVCDLYTAIACSDVKYKDMSSIQMSVYENFLVDLKMGLLNEDDSIAFIDSINSLLDILHDDNAPNSENEIHVEIETASAADRDNFPWTEYEEELVSSCFKQGQSIDYIASSVRRTAISIKKKLADMGLVTSKSDAEDNAEKAESEDDNLPWFTIENSGTCCSIFNERDERVFRTNGRFKVFDGMPYRLNYKSMCFTIKGMKYIHGIWEKGTKKIVAYEQSDLYKVLDVTNYDVQVEDFVEGERIEDNKVKVDGIWYDFDGYKMALEDTDVCISVTDEIPILCDNDSLFIPKGKLKSIDDIVKCPYDYLWIVAIVDMIYDDPDSTMMSLDDLACMMIAEAWSLFYYHTELANKESLSDLQKAITFLAKESEEYMEEPLVPQASREFVYEAIRDYPMAGDFEDAVDTMLTDAPYDILKAWIKSDGADLVMDSINFSNACLYALHLGVKNKYIEVNKNWVKYLSSEHERLRNYYVSHLVNYVVKDKVSV